MTATTVLYAAAMMAAGAVLTTCLSARAAGAEPLARFTVAAGEHERVGAPVSAALEKSMPAKGVRLEEVRDGRRLAVAAQVEAGDPPHLAWVLSGTTPAGAERVFELVRGDPPPGPGIDVRQDAKALTVTCGGAEVLTYHKAEMPPPNGKSPLYARSAFIHPLRAPDGQVLTAIHPADHIHHMGLWNPWTSTKFEGRKVDFWNLAKGQGAVRHKAMQSTTSGPVFGGFRAVHEHVDLSAPGGEKVALTEDYQVRVWRVGGTAGGEKRAAPARQGTDAEAWIVDFDLTQRCASDSPLELPHYRYGGFGFRATEKWNKSNSDYLTSEGKTRQDGHATRSRWCITCGTTDAGPAGIVFMSHPANREHPEPMRIWPQGPVFFNYCPVQQKDWVLEPGRNYRFRYRLYVYAGKRTAGQAERLWQGFADPPVVAIERPR